MPAVVAATIVTIPVTLPRPISGRAVLSFLKIDIHSESVDWRMRRLNGG
uniref:Uncharacterized protein n=1 Tax=uncultured SAR11 cluster alpha proteobacterium H17925_45G17 TaxID=715038 RepID=E7CA19_9PROT|nr:hypothetical protein [uncultured SAR11 cluster alpha proteobacterium H17925_45G17]